MLRLQQFAIAPSRLWRCYLYVIHLFMLSAAWFLPLPLWSKVFFSIVIIVALVRSLQCMRRSLTVLSVNDLQEWRIQSYGTPPALIDLATPCYVGTWYIVIPFKRAAHRQWFCKHLVIVKDSLTELEYRQLCVRLFLLAG